MDDITPKNQTFHQKKFRGPNLQRDSFDQSPIEDQTATDQATKNPNPKSPLNHKPSEKIAKTTTTPNSEKPNLSNYTNFRKYLEDFYTYKVNTEKNALHPYSYKIFSAAANIKSPSYLKLIIEGQRNLSPSMVQKFAKALRLEKNEIPEFQALVDYGQAKDPLERNRALKTLNELRTQRLLKQGEINQNTWNKVSNWLTWVLYSMADQEGVNFTPQQIQKLLRGRTTLARVKKATQCLIQSGELVENPSTGEVKKGRLLINDSQNVSTEMIRKIQSELIYIGLESLFQDDITDREFGSVTMALTEDEFEKMKFELRQMKKRFFKDIAKNREKTKGDRVYQLNIQLFPVTDRAKTDKVKTDRAKINKA